MLLRHYGGQCYVLFLLGIHGNCHIPQLSSRGAYTKIVFFLCVQVTLLCMNKYGQSLFHLGICCSFITNSFGASAEVNEMQHCKVYFMNMDDLHVHLCSLYSSYYTFFSSTHSPWLETKETLHWLVHFSALFIWNYYCFMLFWLFSSSWQT